MIFIQKLRSFVAVIALAVVSLHVGFAQAQIVELVTNGSLTGTAANAALPSGWLNGVSGTTFASTADTVDTTHNVGVAGYGFAASPSASPDGGTWAGIARNGRATNENFYQVVSGFIIGNTYTISWYDANFGIDDTVVYKGNNSVLATLTGGSENFSFTGSLSNLGSGWSLNTFTFTPTETAYTLNFGLKTNAKSYLSIDGISITTDVAAVPEPEAWVFLMMGMLMIGFEVRRRNFAKIK